MSTPSRCDGGAPRGEHVYYRGMSGCYFCGMAKPAYDETRVLLELQRDKYQALADAAPAGSGARKAAMATVECTLDALKFLRSRS